MCVRERFFAAMSTDEQLAVRSTSWSHVWATCPPFAGDEAFELIESVRTQARRFADGDLAVADDLNRLLASLANEQCGS